MSKHRNQRTKPVARNESRPREIQDPKSSLQNPRSELPARPFTPRRTVFIVLSVAFALWIVALIVMYFTTVYGRTAATPA